MWYNVGIMGKRIYTKYTEICSRLRAYCDESRRNGRMVLPGERELAAVLGTHRPTLAKAIRSALDEGFIRREGKRTEILPDRGLEGRCILFVTVGWYSSILWNAFERLYLRLKPIVEGRGGVLKLFLHNRESSEESFDRAFAGADTVLLTIVDGCDSGKALIARLKEFSAERPGSVIALSDPWLEAFPDIIALDNRAVGRIAALCLASCGCRKTVCLSDNANVMFRKRWEGFQDAFRGFGSVDLSLLEQGDPESCRRGADTLVKALDSGVDGAFIVTDEQSPLICSGLFRRQAVPGRMKIVTFNGSGQSLGCDPPLAAVNHGTSEEVRLILERLGHPEMPCRRMLIEPGIYLNRSMDASKAPELIQKYVYKGERT